MKTLPFVAVCCASFCLYNCQPNSSRQADALNGPAQAEHPKKEQQKQASILEKDTLNAVQEEPVRKPTTTPSVFEAFFQNFSQTIRQQDAAAFNQYLHPRYGLYVIESSGALPQFTRVTDIRTFKRVFQQKPFFTIKEEARDCDLQEVKTLPKLTCEGNDAYAAHGCFVTDAAAFRKNEAHLYANLPDEEKKAIAQTQLLVTKTVLHTDSGFKFHFAQLDGQWRVLFIDLTVPCSA